MIKPKLTRPHGFLLDVELANKKHFCIKLYGMKLLLAGIIFGGFTIFAKIGKL